MAARAGIVILVMFGVIFASTGSRVPRRTARHARSTSAGLTPTSAPIASFAICGQEKLHSMISTPACSDKAANFCHSSADSPIMEDTITFSGNLFFKFFNAVKFSSKL